jgi:hypothetical protein
VVVPNGPKTEALNAARAATVFAWEIKNAAGRDRVG